MIEILHLVKMLKNFIQNFGALWSFLCFFVEQSTLMNKMIVVFGRITRIGTLMLTLNSMNQCGPLLFGKATTSMVG